MSSDRKYRQPGYRDSDRDRRAPRPAPPPRSLDGPRGPRMPAPRTVSRCAECGTLLPPLTDPRGRCPRCGAELHACKQCSHFDPGRRFECAQPVPERIPDKTARNDCPFFALRVTVERESSSRPVRPEDARRAFESLFKK